MWLIESQPGFFYVYRAVETTDDEWLVDNVEVFVVDEEDPTAQRVLIAYIADVSAAHAFQLYETLANAAPILYDTGYGNELPPTGLLEEARITILLDK